MEADDRTREIFRRITYRIVPFVFVCYLIAMIDRLNVGFAKLQFMGDLGLSETQFGLAASLLYVGYILFEVPSNLMMQKQGLGKTLLRIMVLWGIVTILLAFAHSAVHFYILRFMIGVAEAGFLPGVLLYLTYWFPEHMRGRMTSWFVTALPVSGIIGGPLAGWLMTSADGAYGLKGWQWLFMLEGIPATILGVVAYFLLARTPSEASWLTEEERAIVTQEIEDDWPTQPGQPKSFLAALSNLRIWGLAVTYFLFFCVENALLVWIPTLLKSIGTITIFEIGWLSGGISVVAMVGMRYISLSSDRRRERRWHVIGCGLVSGVCFTLLPLGATSVVITTILLMIAAVAVFAFLALFWTIPSAYLRGTSAAGGLALISSIGAMGGVFSPIYIGWMKDFTGSYYGSLVSLGFLLILGMIILYASLYEEVGPVGAARPVETAR